MQTRARESKTSPRLVSIPVANFALSGKLVMPLNAQGVVLLAHQSDSDASAQSTEFVASVFHEAKLGTLTVDFIHNNKDISDNRKDLLRFDLDLISNRLIKVIDWLIMDEDTSGLPIGVFVTKSGAPASLITACRRSKWVKAVVALAESSHLATEFPAELDTPSLLIVSDANTKITVKNRSILQDKNRSNDIAVIKGASKLFEESSGLEIATELAKNWFEKYLQ